jgi:hypothetical protein
MTTNQSGSGRPIISERRASDAAWRSISESVRALEGHLGDPRRPEGGFSFDRLHSIIPQQLATRSAPENGIPHAVSDEPSHRTALQDRMPT